MTRVKSVINRLLLSSAILGLAAGFSCSVSSCSSSEEYRNVMLHSMQDSLNAVRTPLYLRGSYDSVVSLCRDLYNMAISRSDSLAALDASVHIAQSFMHMENADSAMLWLETAESLVPASGTYGESVLYFIRGDWWIKSRLDYAEALRCYLRGYDISRRYGDVHGMAVALFDIVDIFYIRADSYGRRYAEELMELSRVEGVDPQTVYYAMISMAQMLYVGGDLEGASGYVRSADSVAVCWDIEAYSSLQLQIQGEIYNSEGRYEEADSCYNAALSDTSFAINAVEPLVYLSYSRMCKKRGEWDRAVSLAREGLRVTYEHSNVEVRLKLMEELMDLYYRCGKADSVMYYYRRMVLEDSIVRHSSEQDFNNLLLRYQQLESDYAVQERELRLAQVSKRSQLQALVIIMAAVIIVCLWFVYRRKQSMYRTLVEQYQTIVAKMSHDRQKKAGADDRLRQLYDKIEDEMQGGLWRSRSISLASVAEMTGSNRTYVSKAVNTFSGLTFSGYVNRYRIAEAVRIITADGDSVLFKQLSDDLGFSSPEMFFQAFRKETGMSPTQYRKTLNHSR